MKCAKQTPKAPFPCGQCMHCRVNNLRKKAARFKLEGLHQGPSSFCTLTYDGDHVPLDECPLLGVAVETLKREHMTAFIKALRKRSPPGLRFALVGEYGERTGRPHYHVILFGVPPETATPLLEKCWTKGFVQCGPCTEKGMDYVAGYVLKKMTKEHAFGLQPGAAPEFFRQSHQPPIGGSAIPKIAALCRTKAYLTSDAYRTHYGAPYTFRLGDRIYPLDRTMRRNIMKYLGWEPNEDHRQPYDPHARATGVDLQTGEIHYDYADVVLQEQKLRRTIAKRDNGKRF